MLSAPTPKLARSASRRAVRLAKRETLALQAPPRSLTLVNAAGKIDSIYLILRKIYVFEFDFDFKFLILNF